jgi:hypothetical protein
MSPIRRWSRSLSLSLVALVAASACSHEEEAPPPAAKPEPPKPKAPEIDATVKKALDDDAAAARGWVEEARALKQKGLDADRVKDGTGAANYTEAASLITRAVDKMGKWCETTGKENQSLTSEQREYYIRPLLAERQGWVQDAARLGILIRGK